MQIEFSIFLELFWILCISWIKRYLYVTREIKFHNFYEFKFNLNLYELKINFNSM